MNNEKKKISDKKVPENLINSSIVTNQTKTKLAKKGTIKLASEKEIKIEEDPNEENSKGSNSIVSSTKSFANKNKKNLDSSLSSTPKSGNKISGQEKTLSKPLNSFVTNMTNLKKKSVLNKGSIGNIMTNTSNNTQNNSTIGKTSQINKSPTHEKGSGNNVLNYKDPIPWSQNSQTPVILTNFESCINNQIKEIHNHFFSRLCGTINSEFFIQLNKFKKEMNELLNVPEKIFLENHNFLLRYIEGIINQINTKLTNMKNNSTMTDLYYYNNTSNEDNLKNNLNFSTISDDGFIDYIYLKNNSVAFEIPLKRERAMSENDEKNSRAKDLQKRFSSRIRLSSEEIEKRMKEKHNNVARNKNTMRLQYYENFNKLINKINDIKQKKKKEKIENLQKLTEKLEKYNLRHQQFLNEKISKAKNEQEKVAEINFLHRMEKENKDLNIIKKLDISIERREQYIMKRLNKMKERSVKEEAVEKKRKFVEDEFKNKIMKKLEKNQKKRDDDLESKFTIDNKIELVNKRKQQIEERLEFFKNVYSENFIWELLEADYFDVEELYNITNITKFELVKAKLKKDQDLIDKLYDKNNKSKISSKIKTNNYTETQYSNDTELSNYKVGNLGYNDENILVDSDNDSIEIPKRSKSFTIFNENDFQEIDYLFKDTNIKKKKEKEEKKET